jgi:hypothetical protein
LADRIAVVMVPATPIAVRMSGELSAATFAARPARLLKVTSEPLDLLEELAAGVPDRQNGKHSCECLPEDREQDAPSHQGYCKTDGEQPQDERVAHR